MEAVEKNKEKVVNALNEINSIIKDNELNVKYLMASVLTNSNVLLKSSHGKAKSLLAKTVGKVTGLSTSRVQGSQGLTESKYLARYDIPALMNGKEKIIWKDFIDADIKFIDEINRVHPTALNAVFPILAENTAEFGGESRASKEGSFIATLNPADEATFEMPAPLIDRFDIAINLMSTNIFSKIKIIGCDTQEPEQILTLKEVEVIKKEIILIEVSNSTKFKVSCLVRDIQICKHQDKEFLENFPQCCEDCAFKNNTCRMVHNSTPLSDRTYISAIKFIKAMSYIDNIDPSKVNLKTLFKFLLNHKIRPTNLDVKYNTQFEFIEDLITKIDTQNKFRADAFQLIAQIKTGKTTLDKLEPHIKNDLLVKEMFEQLKKDSKIKSVSLLERVESMTVSELEETERRLSEGELSDENTVEVLQRIEELKSSKLGVETSFDEVKDLDRFINELSYFDDKLVTKISNRISQSKTSKSTLPWSSKDTGFQITVIRDISNSEFTVNFKCDNDKTKKLVNKVVRSFHK